MGAQKPDFSGWATKAGLKCTDGRTIMKDAFAHQDKLQVPLVWQHGHNDPENILGYAILEHRDEGVYCYGYFNDTVKGEATKKVVAHGDVSWLSIYANNLVERSKQVYHGAIREVSLVIAGANPGARIDRVVIEHGDGTETPLEDEAVITTGLAVELMHSDEQDTAVEHADSNPDGETVQDIYDSFTPKQKEVVHFMIGAALEASDEEGGSAKHSATSEDSDENSGDGTDEGSEDGEGESSDGSDDNSDNSADDAGSTDNTSTEGDLAHQEGNHMSRNTFDENGAGTGTAVDTSKRLTHDQLVAIVKKGKESGSFKDAVLAHAEEYGITDIELLFPDAKALTETPEFISRRMEWVSVVLGGTRHSPFAKVKTLLADITEPEARAKGYIKGNRKKEEVFKLLKRTTGPATIYKKQKLDRDDMLDITDINVVNWLKAEMRLMIEEELARAILVGDGRSSLDEDKVKDPEGALDGTGIRSIYHDDDLYAIKRELAANVSPKDAVKGLVRARSKYRGSGQPTLFISDNFLTDIMLEEDKFGRALYETQQALADKLRVKDIVGVDIFDEHPGLVAIMVSLQDYTIGSNRGGELTSFEDFDIDFNQHKYLQETRLSGGLTKPFSAVVITRGEGTLATPQAPSFDGATNTISIPTVTGISYFNAVSDEELTGDVVIDSATEVEARPDAGYYMAANQTDSWTYTP
jgi:hypothetical protein